MQGNRLLRVFGCACALVIASRAPAQRAEFEEVKELLQNLQVQIGILRLEIGKLNERLGALEAAPGGGETGAGKQLPGAPAGEPVMLLLNHRKVASGEDRTVEIQALRTEAKALEAKAQTYRDDAVRFDMYPWWGVWRQTTAPSWWAIDKELRHKAEYERKQSLKRLKNLALRYEREAKAKFGQATRLEKNSESERLILSGWDGKQYVTLESDRDLSKSLGGKTGELYVTWSGDLIALDSDEGVTWEITSLEVVEKPSGFEPPPDEETGE